MRVNCPRAFAISSVVLLMILCLTGCGNAIAQAREIARDASFAQYDALRREENVRRSISDAEEKLADGNGGDSAAAATVLLELDWKIDGYITSLNLALRRLSYLDNLDGVQDYMTFRSMMGQVATIDLEAAESLKASFRSVEPTLEELSAGSSAEASAAVEAFLTECQALMKKLDDAERLRMKADAFRLTNDLF